MAWALDERKARTLLEAVDARAEHVFIEREIRRRVERTNIRDDMPGVQAFPRLSVGGRRMHYPWEQWTDGRWWLFAADLDYMNGRESFVTSLYGRAARDGKTVMVHKAQGCIAARFA